MKFSLENGTGNSIYSYDTGQIQLLPGSLDQEAGKKPQLRVITRSVIVTPIALLEDWQPQSAGELSAEHFDPVLEMQPELIVLGTGARIHFPAGTVLARCYQAGVGVEVMDTGAACRTYNILAAEGRRVAAALLMIEAG